MTTAPLERFDDGLRRWFIDNEAALRQLGEVVHQWSPDDGRDNASRHVALNRSDGGCVDLIVWADGHASFSYGYTPPGVTEALILTSEQELRALLERFLMAAHMPLAELDQGP